MKNRLIIFCLVSFLCVFSVAGQNSRMMAANRNTAVRCLKLAENFLLGGDYNNALTQAELGLSYDEGISDLYYIKAAALSNNGKTRSEVIEIINSAFFYDDWVNYNKNGARILLADLLSDIGEYDKSTELLNSEPFIYSSDAEFIRIKNFYRKGSPKDLEQARLKINSSRRIYPDDERFPSIFFMFESLIMNNAVRKGIDYRIPEIVQVIADSYIVKIPDYDKDNIELEYLAAEFASGEKKKRLLRSIDARNAKSDFYAYSGLKEGLISESDSLNLFMETTSETMNLNLLLMYVPLIKADDSKSVLFDYLNSYEGRLLIDENNDLQNEITVVFSRGRPEYIYYDRNNDGINELSVVCDFGVPVSVYYENSDVDLFYDIYPAVKKVNFYKTGYNFNFLHDDFKYSPVSFIIPDELQKLNLEYYVPEFTNDVTAPLQSVLALKSSSVELPTVERDKSSVLYTTLDNVPVFAEFYNDNVKFAECSFQGGLPFVRYVDYNNDGFYETMETYDLMNLQEEGTSIDSEFIVKTFGPIADGWNLRVAKIEIDNNRDTVIDFCEAYSIDGSVISSWDINGDGKWDHQYIKYTEDNRANKTEEYIFYDINETREIRIILENSIPVELFYDGIDQEIIKGKLESIYWLGEKGILDYENKIQKKYQEGLEQGAVTIIEYNEERISVIRIEDKLFCKILPEYEESFLENREEAADD